MSDDEGGTNTNIPKNSSNGSVLLKSEDVLEKLKLLDYDVEFCIKKGFTPFSRIYFAEPGTNAGSQWSSFIALFSWLVKIAGNDFTVDKYDDPNATSNKMMLLLKQMQFDADFPAAKLKQAWGDAVCNVLDFLATQALKTKRFKYGDPIYPETDGFEEAQADEEADLGVVDSEDEGIQTDDEDIVYTDNIMKRDRSFNDGESKRDAHPMEEKTSDMIQGSTNPEFQIEWRAELERVGPRLKRSAQTTGNEWRSHLEQTKKYDQSIQELLPSCTKKMDNIESDLSQSIEVIQSKERILASSFESIAAEYKEVQARVKIASEKFDTTSEVVENLTNELNTVSEALDELKNNMDSRGNSMVDTSPLQNIRTALTNLKSEVQQMEIRAGVVGHSLLRASLASAQTSATTKKKPRSPQNDDGVRSPLPEDIMFGSPNSPFSF